MTWGGVLVFAGTLAIACATPGVATMTIVARIISRGARGAMAFCLGLILGDLVWLSTAALGLSAIAERAAPVLLVIKFGGALYLLVLARAFWTAGPASADRAAPGAATGWAVVQGLALQLGNPKAVLFYVAMVPALVPLDRVTVADVAVLALVIATVLSLVNGIYIAFAVAAGRHFQSARSMRILHRVSATVMVATAGFLLTH